MAIIFLFYFQIPQSVSRTSPTQIDQSVIQKESVALGLPRFNSSVPRDASAPTTAASTTHSCTFAPAATAADSLTAVGASPAVPAVPNASIKATEPATPVASLASDNNKQNVQTFLPSVSEYEFVTADMANAYKEAKRVLEKSLVLSFGSKHLTL